MSGVSLTMGMTFHQLFVVHEFVVSRFVAALSVLLFFVVTSPAQIPSAPLQEVRVTKSRIELQNVPAPKTINIPQLTTIRAKPCWKDFTTFTTEDGLALSGTYCALKDQNNNMWFGTLGGGASKFDGKSFTTFGAAQGLPNGVVRAIVQDQSGTYYFGTGAGITVFDGVNARNYTAADGLPTGAVSSMLIEPEKGIWIGTFGGGIALFDGKTFRKYTAADGLVSNTVRCLEKDKQGNVWIGTRDGVTVFDGKSFRTVPLGDPKEKIVYDIHSDHTGRMWFATAEGIVKFENGKYTRFTTEDGLAGNRVLSIGESNKGKLWFGTHENGLSKYDETHFENITEAEGLPSNRVWAITNDGGGNLWVCTQGKGVGRYNGDALSGYQSSQGLVHSLVWAIEEDRVGNLWFGTDDGLSYFDGEFFRNLTSKHGLPNGAVNTLSIDKNGILWTGTTNGLSGWDGHRLRTFKTEQGLPDNTIVDLAADSFGSVWIATSGAITKFDGKSFENFQLDDPHDNRRVKSIYLDRQNSLWVVTSRDVLMMKGGNFSYLGMPSLAKPFIPSSIIQDENNNYWIGSAANGILRYDGSSFKHFSVAEGLPNEVVYDMDLDPVTGDIWLGTNLGLVKVAFRNSANQIIPAGLVSGKNEALSAFGLVCTEYNSRSGFPLKDLNSKAMFVTSSPPGGRGKDAKSIVWGGFGDHKLFRFDPSIKPISSSAPVLEIRSVKLHGRNIPWLTLQAEAGENDSLSAIHESFVLGTPLTDISRDSLREEYQKVEFDSLSPFTLLPQNLTLPHTANVISFDFHAIETSKNFAINYQYRLKGQGGEWSYPSKKTDATFTNLWEGNYTFEVRAQDAAGTWTKPASFSFKVLAPWWRTWPMYFAYAITVIVLLISFLRVRERRLQNEKSVLQSLVMEATREANIQKEEALRQKKIVEERNEAIQAQLEQTEKDLSNQTLDMIHRQNLFKDIQAEIERLSHDKNPAGLQKLATLINVNKTLEKEWDTFNHYFTSVHRDFYDKLRERAPLLSVYEQRLAALVRMSMDNRQIATLLSIEVSSVKMAKYRLKKKLHLDESEDLQQFLSLL